MANELVPVTELTVRFGVPTAGWMRVELETPSARFETLASYTPFDSIRELVEALIGIAHGTEGSVAFSEEPARLAMVLTPRGNDVALVLTRFRDHRRIAGSGEVVLAIAAPRDVLLWAFWRGLRRLMGSVTPGEYKLQMHRPFPETEMMRLSALLRPT